MKNLIIIVISLCFLQTIYSQELPVYNFIEAGTIPWGNGPGELGMKKGIGATHPSHFSFDRNGTIYVADKNNTRINLYTRDIKFIREIKTASGIVFSPDLVIDPSGNIFGASERNFYKINPEGKQIYAVQVETFGRFWAHQGYGIVFPDTKQPIIISRQGKILSSEASKEILSTFKVEIPIFSSEGYLSGTVLTDLLKKLRNEGLYFAGHRLLSFDFPDYRKLWTILGLYSDLPDYRELLDVFLGCDRQGNSYWYFVDPGYTTYFFAVFSPYGHELAKFTVNISFGQPMISPEGDMYVVYYADYVEKQLRVYRLDRRW